MRIRNIIIDSLKLPFKDYKSFILVYILMFICELFSFFAKHTKMGNYYLLFLFIRIIFTLILVGISMTIINHVVFDKSLDVNIKNLFLDGFKEYVITFYYLLVLVILNIIIAPFSGIYSSIIEIQNYVMEWNIDAASLTVMELSHQIPHALNINFLMYLQIHVLIMLFLFVLLVTFSFISRILMFRTNNLKVALDVRNVFRVVHNIGYIRFMKFVLIFTIILIFVVNFLELLDLYFDDILITTLFEVFLLFFATNAFYKLYFYTYIKRYLNPDYEDNHNLNN